MAQSGVDATECTKIDNNTLNNYCTFAAINAIGASRKKRVVIKNFERVFSAEPSKLI
jgi:hypothetical protein